MPDMKFQAVVLRGGRVVREEAVGEIVTLPGYEDWEFVLHPALGAGSGWVVSEPITGLAIGPTSGMETREQAVQAALVALERELRELDLADAIERGLEWEQSLGAMKERRYE